MRANSEKPWYRKVKDAWYCWKDGKQVSLGVKGKDNKKAAQEAFYRLMAAKDEQPPKHNPEQKPDKRKQKRALEFQEVKAHDASSSLGDDMLTTEEMDEFAKRVAEQLAKKPEAKTTTTTLQQLVDGFLKDKQDEICVEAWRGYRKYLHPFAAKFGTRQAETLTAEEAEDFVKKPEWSSTYRAGCLGTIVSLYRWGVRKKLLTSSPVEGVKKPPKVSRGTKAVISEAEHKRLLEVADDDFRDFLIMLWNTGARPSEITSLTAEQVNTAVDGVIPLDSHKTSHKGKARFLILQGEALEVAKERAKNVGTGLLFTGQNGKLTPNAISAKMERLSNKAGVRRIIAYGYRHTFATTALVKGLPDATVAALLGHSDTTMLHKHYSHLTAQSRAMKEAMAKVRP